MREDQRAGGESADAPRSSLRLVLAARILLPTLVATAVTMVFGQHWVRAALILAVGATIMAVGMVVPRVVARGEQRLVRVLRSAGLAFARVLTALGLGLLHLFVILPGWAWFRLVGRDPMRVGAGQGFSEEPTTSGRAARSWSPEVRSPPRFTTLLRGAAVITVLATIVTTKPWEPDPPLLVGGYPYSTYAHENEPFARELFDAQAVMGQTGDPRLDWTVPEYTTRYINIRDRSRRSWSPPSTDLVVWFFGGSAMFGVGQRDEHTIPSEVARLAARDGIGVKVVNFGAPGYVVYQDSAMFTLLLAEGRRPPDLAVFYDGVNDFSVVCRQMQTGRRPNLRDNLEHDSQAEQDQPSSDCSVDIAESTRRLAGRVQPEYDAIRATARRHGVPVVFAWQPTIFTKQIHPADQPLFDRLHFTIAPGPPSASPLGRAVALIEPPPLDLTRALDGVPGPVLFDSTHTNEAGARAVATILYRSLRPQLRAMHAPAPG